MNHAEARMFGNPRGADARHRHAGRVGIDVSMRYPVRIIVLTFREGCLCTPIQEGLICVIYEPIFRVLQYWPGLPPYRSRRAAAAPSRPRAVPAGRAAGRRADGR